MCMQLVPGLPAALRSDCRLCVTVTLLQGHNSGSASHEDQHHQPLEPVLPPEEELKMVTPPKLIISGQSGRRQCIKHPLLCRSCVSIQNWACVLVKLVSKSTCTSSNPVVEQS